MLRSDLYTFFIIMILFMSGASLGSYLLCVGERLVGKEKVIRLNSICPHCGHVLSWLDLIPLFSWLFLKGRCRYCEKRIPAKHPVTELFMGLLFVALYLKYGFSPSFFKDCILFSFLFTASVSDWLSGTAENILFSVPVCIWMAMIPFINGPKYALIHLAAAIIFCATLLIIIILLERLAKKTVMGGADIKALFLIFLYLSWPASIHMLIASALISIVLYIVTLIAAAIENKESLQAVTYIPLLFCSSIIGCLAV